MCTVARDQPQTARSESQGGVERATLTNRSNLAEGAARNLHRCVLNHAAIKVILHERKQWTPQGQTLIALIFSALPGTRNRPSICEEVLYEVSNRQNLATKALKSVQMIVRLQFRDRSWFANLDV
jgi:hypothetical protein